MFQHAFRNVTCERPPRPRLFGTGPFLDGAATPPWQGGEYARLNLCPVPAVGGSKEERELRELASREPELKCYLPGYPARPTSRAGLILFQQVKGIVANLV